MYSIQIRKKIVRLQYISVCGLLVHCWHNSSGPDSHIVNWVCWGVERLGKGAAPCLSVCLPDSFNVCLFKWVLLRATPCKSTLALSHKLGTDVLGRAEVCSLWTWLDLLLWHISVVLPQPCLAVLSSFTRKRRRKDVNDKCLQPVTYIWKSAFFPL